MQNRERTTKTEETGPAVKWYTYGFWTRKVCENCTQESKISL